MLHFFFGWLWGVWSIYESFQKVSLLSLLWSRRIPFYTREIVSCKLAQDCRTSEHRVPKWGILCKQTYSLGMSYHRHYSLFTFHQGYIYSFYFHHGVWTMCECKYVHSVHVDIRWQLSGVSSLLPSYVLRSKLGSSCLQGKQLHSLSHFAGLNIYVIVPLPL